MSNQVEFTVTEAPTLSSGARVYQLTCRHGVSSAAMIPGAKPLSDVVVMDVTLPGHHRRNGCACLPGPLLEPQFEARA